MLGGGQTGTGARRRPSGGQTPTGGQYTLTVSLVHNKLQGCLHRGRPDKARSRLDIKARSRLDIKARSRLDIKARSRLDIKARSRLGKKGVAL